MFARRKTCLTASKRMTLKSTISEISLLVALVIQNCRSQRVYLVGEVFYHAFSHSCAVLIVHLFQSRCQNVFFAEQRVVPKCKCRNVNIKLISLTGCNESQNSDCLGRVGPYASSYEFYLYQNNNYVGNLCKNLQMQKLIQCIAETFF